MKDRFALHPKSVRQTVPRGERQSGSGMRPAWVMLGFCLWLTLCSACASSAALPPPMDLGAGGSVPETSMPDASSGMASDVLSDFLRDARRLEQAYPGSLIGFEIEYSGNIFALLHNGQRVVYHDTRAPLLDDDGQLINATLRQSLAERYPAGPERQRPVTGSNPGRARSAEWLGALYGTAPNELQLITLRVHTSAVPIAAGHGMAQAFTRVAHRLNALQGDAALAPFILPIGGQYWRVISGTKRLSPHSYGIAIDLNPDRGPYWRWSKAYPETAIRNYPEKLVALFEANGFIWGGKWDAFDVMHFEYRPELFSPVQDTVFPPPQHEPDAQCRLLP